MAEIYPNTNVPGSSMDPCNFQMNFEHSDFFEFTDRKLDDLELIVSGYPESQNYDAVNFGGSSSYHEDPNGSKHITTNSFISCWIVSNGQYHVE